MKPKGTDRCMAGRPFNCGRGLIRVRGNGRNALQKLRQAIAAQVIQSREVDSLSAAESFQLSAAESSEPPLLFLPVVLPAVQLFPLAGV